MPFRKVLIATDFSDPATEAARLARGIAGRDAAYRVVHVLPSVVHSPFVSRPDEALLQEAALREERHARERLQALIEEADLPDADVEIGHGSVGREIARIAEAFGADLVAVGARGQSMWERVLLGSKARSVLHATDGNVLVARPGGAAAIRDADARVAVATDFQPPAIHAGRRAVEVAEATGAELIALHVLDPAVWGSVMDIPLEMGGGHVGYERVDRQWLSRTMAKSLHQFNDGFLHGRAREELPEGEPVKKTTEVVEREGVGLLVVGSHRPGAVERALLGSVAEALVERAPCSVLVVRERP